MLLKLVVIFLSVYGTMAQKEHQDWEIAVVINDKIELLQANGTLLGSTVEQFTTLKALTFDNIRHLFVVSDMDQGNDTIFTVQLTKETEITPIIPDLPDDVQGLAIDPIEDILYWTDSVNKTINYVYLNDSLFEPKLLFQFTDVTPQDIAIDVCRRFIYWTNSDTYHPTIERAFLNGSNREILIDSDLRIVSGIAIDYKSQRLYWADMREGIYYRIESANLDGGEREIIFEGTHSKPFGIAVDESSIYWTDINNNALWRYFKSDKGDSEPVKIREFPERPMGIIAKNIQIKNYPDCKELESVYENYKGDQKEVYQPETSGENIIECLNGGQLAGNFCKCKRGYTGRFCETQNCHNFCIHGSCHLSSKGYPQCHCPRGFGGTRCEVNRCEDFCLNGGTCNYFRGDVVPSCDCTQHYTGSRCEISTDFNSLCNMYCHESTSKNDYLVSKNRDLVCRCEAEGFVISKNNLTVPALYSEDSPFYGKSFMEKFSSDSDYATLVLLLGFCLVIIIALGVYQFASRNKRPIIKKRVIVNKNVTPLTYRPQPTTEQCEITIENCCNMNVCETPCFEPSGFRSKNKEDKKILLADMDNGEESY
ncbi:unnamed protein product [Ceutorhynchus assimilis]|uniref:Protein cueball n=1 Tax=Ceutorhynchus assimilis TaxID=467358 RepID=A0A9N9MV34_9CUCU|nr:unnamed protein product [Ceutorhynchus assimilis]